MTTLGQFLSAADARLAALGGYQTEVAFDPDTITLFHIDPASGARVIHGQCPREAGVAPEDAARDLLESLRPHLDAEKLAFADTYFVVGFAPTPRR